MTSKRSGAGTPLGLAVSRFTKTRKTVFTARTHQSRVRETLMSHPAILIAVTKNIALAIRRMSTYTGDNEARRKIIERAEGDRNAEDLIPANWNEDGTAI